MNLVIYTAIFGGYDILKPPRVSNKNIRYICFTDRFMTCPPWKIIYVKSEFKDKRRESRKYKILSHRYFKDFEYSIYLDGNFEILEDLSKYVSKWLDKNQIAVRKHPERNCLYDEAKGCIKWKKDDRRIILKQISRYKNKGYPENNGLTANGFIIRRHTKKIEKFNEMWWNEIQNFSTRDQISFCYVMYELNLNYSIIPNDDIKKTLKREEHELKQLKNKMKNFTNSNERLYYYIMTVLSNFILIISFFYSKPIYKVTMKNYKRKTFSYIWLPKILKYFIDFIY